MHDYVVLYEDEQLSQMVGTLAGVGALSGKAVGRLVADTLGVVVEPAVRVLVAAAEGNPLLLAELLDGVRAEGVTDGPGRARTPERVQGLVRATLRGTPTGSWQLLRVAAVLGRSCQLAELAAMTGRNTAQMLPDLDALLDAGLLDWAGDDLAFRHELVWWAVLDALPPAVRQALHTDRDRLRRRRAVTGAPRAADPAAEPVVPADLRRRIGLRSTSVARERRPDGSGAWESFSGVERAIARLVAEGMTNRQIATRVRLSPHTVNYHLRGMFRRLGISSRAELVRHVPVSSAA
ncbi:regulatory protein, luxR family [Micromonospora peucetia]|uniref:Regulatory protein, luxR family n=1 Tax=Micromonospora peucetia TaxID=47871 RepID=A0A1C6U936_9ACTN|nr:regulatory protein, luxR family [Micromonospora peucetia]